MANKSAGTGCTCFVDLLIGLTLGVSQATNAVAESVAEGVKDEAEQSLYTHQELKLESEVAEE